MFQQLVKRMTLFPSTPKLSDGAAAFEVLTADPLDLMLHMEEVWTDFNPWGLKATELGKARETLVKTGKFSVYRPSVKPYEYPANVPAWEHLGYSYLLENTRVVQILKRVVREYRSGEALGIPSASTQRWLDATEALLYSAANPLSPWLSTSFVRGDTEAVRRNAYWRMFGLDLAFMSDTNQPVVYDKAKIFNQSFLRLFEELLFELWQAISNLRNYSGVDNSDDDRIYRLSEELKYILRSRRQNHNLVREELAAAAVLTVC